jgi:hypothetical protein
MARIRPGDRGAFRSSRADGGPQVLPPARATVPPWLPAKSARVSNLPACCAPGPPASAAQYSCRRVVSGVPVEAADQMTALCVQARRDRGGVELRAEGRLLKRREDDMMRIALTALATICLISVTQARSLTTRDIYSSGTHWCNWSITATCKRWKANKNNPAYFRECGPNDMRSGCVAHRQGLR